MITGAEIPLTLAFLYPLLNNLRNKEKRPIIENELKQEQNETEGIEIFGYENQYDAPTMIFMNNVGIPVGGGTYQTTKFITSSYMSKDLQNLYHNYIQLDQSCNTSYINTHEILNKTLTKYKISSEKYAFSLPLKVNYTNYKTGFYLHPSGHISSDKERLIKKILWERRVPFTITIPAIAGTIMCGCMFFYILDSSFPTLYTKPYLPPFHPKRIASYFSDK